TKQWHQFTIARSLQQYHQGRSTVKNYVAYLPALAGLPSPLSWGWFRIVSGTARTKTAFKPRSSTGETWCLWLITRAINDFLCIYFNYPVILHCRTTRNLS
ncbi:hypothetical protein, partial [Candidatus Erwinia dacicola]|uniref:hypothetical protein n=1 Tax=Candidatus Erwinia dacicola TaxID=252393 RepID=UPI001C9CED89